MNLRVLLYPDIQLYFDANGDPLPDLDESTPLKNQKGSPITNVNNCWPTFLYPKNLNYYITYLIKEKKWILKTL